MDADVLVRDYLGRLEVAAAGLPADRRAELAAEVRDHIDAALAETGRSDEVTVRNVLERLGPPEEIVAAEGGQSGRHDAAAPAAAGVVAGARSRWGALEVAAVVLLGLAWPALFLPLGLFLWMACGAVGLVLVWASGLWTWRRKLPITGIVVVAYVLLFLVITAGSVTCTTGNPPQPCSAGGAAPTWNGIP
jgi:uncharacterized membrane protein